MSVRTRVPRRSTSLGSAGRIFLTSFLIPGVVAAGSALLVFMFLDSYHLFERADDEIAWIRRASEQISERYYEPVTPERLAWDAIRGMALRDGYSDFIDPDHEAQFREENEGRYVGIGFAVYMLGEPVTVLYSFPGSPAREAGIETGDRIIGVDGVDCTDRDSDDIINRIKIMDGEGRPVTITVRPYAVPGEEPRADFDVEVRRDTIWRPSVVDPRIVDSERGIAYVRLKAFQEHSIGELHEALTNLTTKGMNSLVLDLRGNRGGLLEQAVGVSSLFLDDGVVVRTKGRAPGTTKEYKSTGLTEDGIAPFRGLPLVLLVNENSASSSEIVAGALQDHQRALLVGERTFGKGMVQTVIPCYYRVDGKTRSARLKITTSRYFTPAGRAIEEIVRDEDGIHRREPATGLWPDVAEVVEDQREERWLERYLDNREIPDETWQLIEDRCPEQPHYIEDTDGFSDRQLERAVELLAGKKSFRVIS